MYYATHRRSQRILQLARQAVCSVAHVVHRQHIFSFAIALALVIGLMGQVLAPASIASAAPASQGGGSWAALPGSVNEGHTATRLLDGRVLVVGGGFGGTKAAQLYDPATGTWSPAASTIYAHGYHVAALLNDGRVLVAGSGNSNWADHGLTEIYNPATNTWTETGSMSPRSLAAAVTLADGRVLVAAGIMLNESYANDAEIYNPATGTWTHTNSLSTFRYGPAITRLADGRVLLSGGLSSTWMGGAWNTAEIYNPATNSWTLTSNMSTGRANHTSTLLPNGKVLVAGYSNSQVYDPATNTWSAPVSLNKGRSNHGAVLLNNGRVLVAGGSWSGRNYDNTAEIYDPATNTWSLTAPMSSFHGFTRLTLLTNGQVFLSGWPNNELYTPQP